MSKRAPYEPSREDGAKVFWKSLESKAKPDEYAARAKSEMGVQVSGGLFDDLRNAELHRRGFLTLGAITTALFAEGCARRPVEKLMPYVKAQEQVLPGIANHYATVRVSRGDAIGLVVESHDGRPTKIEGNVDHPSSLGATDLVTQAAVFDLYDPDRSRSPMRSSRIGSVASQTKVAWSDVEGQIADLVRSSSSDQGARLRFLVPPSISPTFLRLRDAVLAKFPQAKFYTYTSVHETNARDGAKLAFGQVVNVVPDYAQARCIVTIDSDFLGTEPGSVRATRGFAASRRVRTTADGMSRLYVVEPTLTVTGMNADHRLRSPARECEKILVAIAKELSATHQIDLGPVGSAVASANAGAADKWVRAVAKDLAQNRAKSIVAVGSRQPARVHALAHALNAALGNAGQTVAYYPPADPTERDQLTDIKSLAAEIEQNRVSTLVILGGNPVYDAPSDVKFSERLRQVPTSLHLASHLDETSSQTSWHMPLAHELEAWGDQRALDGTRSIQQPLIAPLHGGRSEIEILARFAGEPAATGHELVKGTLRTSIPAHEVDKVWNASLKRGILSGSVAQPFGPLAARLSEVATALGAGTTKPVGANNLEVTFAPCTKLVDGRHANNMWLQELPDPVSKVTWDNLAYFSPGTAKALDIQSGQMVRLSKEGAKPVDIAAWILPGQADDSIGLTLGWGRQAPGRYGKKHGFDVHPLRTTDGHHMIDGVKVQKLDAGELEAIKERIARPGLAAGPSPLAGRIQPDDPFEVDSYKYKISQTQDHDAMEGRPVAVDATLDEYKKNPKFVQYKDARGKRRGGAVDPKVLPLWNKRDYSQGHKWGMAIDLNACTGCNACVIACQSENNIPSVGKEQVNRGREMYWIRIDRYFSGTESDPETTLQPVACVHCEEAPCENVCPVNATAHSPEGLNDMAYNRCIGTRYCANNCPYKVRRFNFLNYIGDDGKLPDTEKLRGNPDVSIRFRGVMEKCTYCVQRIQGAKIVAKREHRELKDGDIVTACQQACPAEAITFGDLNDPRSKVAELARRDRSYHLLADIGTGPRTSYLGKIRNPNPEMA